MVFKRGEVRIHFGFVREEITSLLSRAPSVSLYRSAVEATLAMELDQYSLEDHPRTVIIGQPLADFVV